LNLKAIRTFKVVYLIEGTNCEELIQLLNSSLQKIPTKHRLFAVEEVIDNVSKEGSD
jgi:hypothetical protein